MSTPHAAPHTAPTYVPSNARALPVIRKIGIGDIREALAKGVDDFRAWPTHVVFLCLIYPVVGLALARLAFGYDMLPLLFPLAAGFALLGPLAAIGLYEMSRRREQGLEVSWRHAMAVLWSGSIGAIAIAGLVLAALFIAWIATANAIYVGIFGPHAPETISGFLGKVFTTARGWELIVTGNAVGLLFALAAFSLSVVTFPLLIDRHTDALTAMLTSLRAVLRNPAPMAAWGLIVAGALALGSLPFFVGLAVVVPVLGHATWHLYRKVVLR